MTTVLLGTDPMTLQSILRQAASNAERLEAKLSAYVHPRNVEPV
jgi:hypothetical protein